MIIEKIGILTSGGDCPGLNAAIRGAAKAVYEAFPHTQIVGIINGYSGLISGTYRVMRREDFSGILTQGGTILGTSRQPYKTLRGTGADSVDKVLAMKNTYQSLGLDCLLILGGNGTHKTARLLSEEGLNVIALPKTIDNDIWGTDFTFGFHTAVEIATDVLDRLHTTAQSHRRVMVVELMGNKAGWLTLYAGLAGGADVILLPELAFSMDKVLEAVETRAKSGKLFSIIAVAEGAVMQEENGLTRKERELRRGSHHLCSFIAQTVEKRIGLESRVVIPGYIQRGGSPCAYDRVLATQFGTFAANAIEKDRFGVSIALQGNEIVCNPLREVAGKTKFVPTNSNLIRAAQAMGVGFGV